MQASVGDTDSFGQGGGRGDGEKRSDSGCILKVEPVRFPKKLKMG
jgi:hypothetical protein